MKNGDFKVNGKWNFYRVKCKGYMKKDGKCSITGYAIKANGIQNEGRMDDCPIRLRKYHRKID